MFLSLCGLFYKISCLVTKVNNHPCYYSDGHINVWLQVQSVIQPNQQSVIQTASNIQTVQLPKGNVILVSKPSSVIHTTQGTLQTLQVMYIFVNTLSLLLKFL